MRRMPFAEVPDGHKGHAQKSFGAKMLGGIVTTFCSSMILTAASIVRCAHARKVEIRQ